MDKKNMKRVRDFMKGFAISGILYPVFILSLFLVLQLLATMASRKTLLDQNRQKLLDTVDNANQTYTNEELSGFITELQSEVQELKEQNTTLSSKVDSLESANSSLQAKLNKNSFFIPWNSSIATDLNTMDENSNAIHVFEKTTANTPCEFGIVINYVFGDRANHSSGRYWHWQLAFCTTNNSLAKRVYYRGRANQYDWIEWKSLD